MSIYLKPLRIEQIACLKEIFKARVEESNLTDRTSLDALRRNLIRGYEARYMGAYVDDEVSPKHCLVMSHFPGMVTTEIVAHISLIYSVPEERGKKDVMETFMLTAENYARANGAGSLLGTSWLYRGSKGIDKLWLRNGFEIQETSYIKHLT